MFFLKKIGCKPLRKRFTAYKYKIYEVFYFISSMAACAAARRAMGTLNGEQLT